MVVCAAFTIPCRSEAGSPCIVVWQTTTEFTEVREVGVDIARRYRRADTSELLFDD
jgi:hypothetical protein